MLQSFLDFNRPNRGSRATKKEIELWSRTRVDGEEEPATSELLIQILPPNTRLDNDIHVLLVELDYAVHIGVIDADAAEGGGEVTLEARAARVPNGGHTVLVAHAQYGGHLLCRSRVRHCYGQPVRVRGRPFRVTMSV